MAAGIEGRDFYKAKSGTSQAAPFVAGLAALYLQAGFSPTETKEEILRGARYVGDLAVDGAAPLAATTPGELVTASTAVAATQDVSVTISEVPDSFLAAEDKDTPPSRPSRNGLRRSTIASSQSYNLNDERSPFSGEQNPNSSP